jgi:hypothetical protein
MRLGRSRDKSVDADPLEQLVEKAAKIVTELKGIDDSWAAKKLSPGAYLREARAIPGASAAEEAILAKAMEQDYVRKTLYTPFERAQKYIAMEDTAGPLRALDFYFSDGGKSDGCLARLGVTRESFLAFVAAHVTRTMPKRFGTANKVGEVSAKRAALIAERDRLFWGQSFEATRDDQPDVARCRSQKENYHVLESRFNCADVDRVIGCCCRD